MLFAALGYWGVGLPASAVFAFVLDLGGAGIWMGLASGLSVVAVLMTARWMMRERLGLLSPVMRGGETSASGDAGIR
jgi:MATE family multidrug resistance protein